MPWIVLGAIAIGLSLGMLGSGGSILTVPVLTYLVGQPEKLAIASSLVIVGGISSLAMLPYALRREVDWPSVSWFGVPGMAGTWLGAVIAQPLPGAVQLVIFAIIMMVAAWRMLAGTLDATVNGPAQAPHAPLRLAAIGLLVGIVTGVVGVGGGFLIVPALLLLVGMGMRRAIGTSLVIIAANAFSGFFTYADGLARLGLALDWKIIATFILIGGIGTLAGNAIGARLPQQRLKQAFGAMLVLMAGYMLILETPRVLLGVHA